jgi:hypothetical protein
VIEGGPNVGHYTHFITIKSRLGPSYKFSPNHFQISPDKGAHWVNSKFLYMCLNHSESRPLVHMYRRSKWMQGGNNKYKMHPTKETRTVWAGTCPGQFFVKQ